MKIMIALLILGMGLILGIVVRRMVLKSSLDKVQSLKDEIKRVTDKKE